MNAKLNNLLFKRYNIVPQTGFARTAYKCSLCIATVGVAAVIIAGLFGLALFGFEASNHVMLKVIVGTGFVLVAVGTDLCLLVILLDTICRGKNKLTV